MLKVGDSIGAIYEFTTNKDGRQTKEWRLVEDKINKIVHLKSGIKYHTKKRFHPLFADDVDDNTVRQENADRYILTKEVFGLNEITRQKAESWVSWANKNIDEVKPIFE